MMQDATAVAEGICGEDGLEAGAERNHPGIVISEGRLEEGAKPRISAFVWGGRVEPGPTLPYGRRRGAA